MNEIDLLYEKLDAISYPESMIKIAGGISRPAFFPGGKGTIDNNSKISDKTIMVLGQDFDTKKKYDQYLTETLKDINKIATWRNLNKLLEYYGINPYDCFFTNAFMGSRSNGKATGKSPGFKDPKFLHDCQQFFLYQLEIQKPFAILALGKYVAKFVSELSSDLNDWKKANSIKEIDNMHKPVMKGVIFDNGIKTNIAIILHPSFRNVNIHRRKYNNLIGQQAEKEMIKSILMK
ncbi:MAG: hypothetical protein Kow0068_14770 [Marinilabiliales bacterium]